MLKTDYQKKEEKTIILQKCLQLIAQFFLGRNDLAAKIFDLVPGAFIFVQIFAQGLDAHVTTVCEQVGDGGVLGIQCNLGDWWKGRTCRRGGDSARRFPARIFARGTVFYPSGSHAYFCFF